MNYIAFDGKIRIVFVFQVASFWPSWESLYKSCIEDERFTIKLMWIDDITGDVAQMSPSKQFLEHENIPYEIFNYDSIMSLFEKEDHPFYLCCKNAFYVDFDSFSYL